MEYRKIKIRNMEFKVQLSGAGVPLIFLHGFGGDAKDWDPLLSHLEGRYHLIRVSLKNFFSTAEPLSFPEQVAYLRELIEHMPELEHSRFHIVSTSYGSALSWALSQQLRTRVLSQALINPMPLDPLRWLRSLELKWIATLGKWPLLLHLYLTTNRGHQALDQLAKVFNIGRNGSIGSVNKRKRLLVFAALQRFLWLARNADWETYLNSRRRRGRALILIGAQDPLFHEEDFRQYEKLFDDSTVQAFATGSHLLLNTHALEIGENLNRFLQGLEVDERRSAETETESQEPAAMEVLKKVEVA